MGEERQDMAYRYWAAALGTVSHEKKRRVCENYGAETFYRMSGDQLGRLHLFTGKETAAILRAQHTCDPGAMWEAFCAVSGRTGMRFIPYDSADYPQHVKNIYNAPFALFAAGALPSETQKSVAIVGARSCSEYGRSVARQLGRTLAGHGVQVISGMAAGIDSASHAGALEAGGDTFAVLGNGCDVCYPRSSRRIYENILSGNGGILSELPPGTQPQPYFFPMRNRIISALADIVVIVEAREKSGSLITADFALEQGKDIFAVPGRYADNLSVGCNRLIEQGAGIIVDMDSFLKNAGIAEESGSRKTSRTAPALSDEAARVYDCLELSARYLDEIAADTGLSLLAVLEALDVLKKNHLAQEPHQNYFCRTL